MKTKNSFLCHIHMQSFPGSHSLHHLKLNKFMFVLNQAPLAPFGVDIHKIMNISYKIIDVFVQK